MKLTYMLKINGKPIDQITKYSSLLTELTTGDEQRNARGGVIRYRIAQIPSLTIETGLLEPLKLQELTQLFALPKFQVEWHDPRTGQYRSGEFYAGDYEVNIFNTNPLLYAPISVELFAYGGIS